VSAHTHASNGRAKKGEKRKKEKKEKANISRTTTSLELKIL